jgi:hypothetical protein
VRLEILDGSLEFNVCSAGVGHYIGVGFRYPQAWRDPSDTISAVDLHLTVLIQRPTVRITNLMAFRQKDLPACHAERTVRAMEADHLLTQTLQAHGRTFSGTDGRGIDEYSNVARGKRQKLGEDGAIPHIIESDRPSTAFRKSWARLIQKIYEVDPLICPKCRGTMRIISFIEDREVIKTILIYLGLWLIRSRPPAKVHAQQYRYAINDFYR